MTDDELPTGRLERLDPPAGGELRLRRALAAPRALRWPLPLAATALASLLLLVAVVYRPDLQRKHIHQALQLAMSPQPEIWVKGAQVTAVPSTDPRVRIYVVVSQRRSDVPTNEAANERPGGAS